MICTPLLVRHPAPHPTESLPGYMLRLAEENGYPSPWRVCLLAGLKQNEIRTSGFQVEKLAAVSNQPSSRLREISFSAPSERPRWARLLNHPVVPTDLSLMECRICPDCVAELGFIEAHWHLRLMLACPKHLRLALVQCSSCGKALRWFRPGLLECQCGASLLRQCVNSIAADQASLLAVIRAKVIGEECRGGNPTSLPLANLCAMDVRSLLATIRILGKYQLLADGADATADERQIVFAATLALSDWPNKFVHLLRSLGEQPGVAASGSVGKQFDGIYRSLTKNKAIVKGQVGFLRAAFIDFVQNHWGLGFVDRKLSRSATGHESRYITLAEFARRVGVQPRTAARLLNSGTHASRRVPCGRSNRVIVDTVSDGAIVKSPGLILRTRDAARQLSLPVSVILELRRLGVFQVRNLPPEYPGWHERDVADFERSLTGVNATSGAAKSTETIALSKFMNNRHLSPVLKAGLIRNLFLRAIPVVGCRQPCIGALQIPIESYRQYVSLASQIETGTSSIAEVARELSCDPATLPGLVRLGHLRAIRTARALRIDNQSVSEFASAYTCLAPHSNSLGTSTRALMRKCRERGLDMLLVERKGRSTFQAFIRNSDLHHVVKPAA